MANRILTRAAISIRSHTLVAAALFGLTLLGANYKLTLGVAAPKWDADMLFAPYQMLLADHARAGKFLLWNPWLNGGSPDYAEPQVGSFSPVAIALGFLTGGTEVGFRVYWLVLRGAAMSSPWDSCFPGSTRATRNTRLRSTRSRRWRS